MRFGNLVIDNFLSLKHASVDLSDRGLVLIEGINVDDPSAKSNGSGKSSLVDALCYCLYGKTARGLSGDAVINRKVGKDCVVSVEVIDGTDKYVIKRFRKTSSGTGIKVMKISKEPDVADFVKYEKVSGGDLTKGTIVENQKLIESIVGCPHEVFVAAVYAGQDAMPDLPAMTDKQLKTLIEYVIGSEQLSRAYESVLRRMVDVSSKISTNASSISGLKSRMEYCASHIDEYSRLIEEGAVKKAGMEHSLAEAEASLKEETEKHADYQKRCEAKISEIAARVDGLMSDLKVVEESRNRHAELQKVIQDCYAQRAVVDRDVARLSEDAKAKVQEVKNIDGKVGTRCSECGKIYTAEDIAEARKIAVAEAKRLIDLAKETKAKAAEIARVYSETSEKLEAAEKVCESYSDKMTELADLNIQRLNIQNKMKIKPSIITELEQKIAAIKSYKPDDGQYKRLLENENKSYDAMSEEMTVLEIERDELTHQGEVLTELKKVFGPSGVRAHVLDTITPILNDRTARYLDALSDGKLRAVWTTLTRTKKGDIREQFSIDVENAVGGGCFDSLSGGEKRKVRVACCLALQEVVASRAAKPIDLFIADEVDHALDEAGVERLIGLLHEKAETCKSLFVISHNPLRNWIDNVITVKKEDGFSTIDE